ncbi:TPA: iron-sulfur cluster assembly scaffold protein [Candidatus Galligastranaerophilus faecipullorum]|nr:iron-sulfur cluster assembly scaffold protein [Candidatus Galligastranaerophilus faecipullorum]
MWEYSDKVKEHYKNPKNVGSIENADAVGEAGALACGDKLKIYLKIDNGIITDAKFQTFGCGSAVASSSILTEMIIGKTLEEAKKITNKDIADELDGLPPEKMHCSVMGHEALEDALKGYFGEKDKAEENADKKNNAKKIVCNCFGVSEEEIIKAIKEKGAKSLDEIREINYAGGGCARCVPNIKILLDKYAKVDTQLNPVQFILKINKVLETNVAHELGKDSGGIELVNVEGKNVYVKLTGTCSSCKNASLTLKNFVETQLREHVDKEINVIEVK